MSSRALRQLACTRPVPATDALLTAAMRSRRLVLLASLLAAADRHHLSVGARQRLAQYWQLLEQADARDRHGTRQVLDGPDVGTWLACALSASTREAFEDALADFGAVAVAAALRARLRFRITLPVRPTGLMLPGWGLYAVEAAAVEVTAGPYGFRVTPRDGGPVAQLRFHYPETAADGFAGADGAHWHSLRSLPGSRTVLDDVDPRRGVVPKTPGGSGRGLPVAPRLSPSALRRWSTSWCAALSLLAAVDPGRAAEVTSRTRSLVPLRRSPGAGVTSATLRAAPGAVFATLPDTPLQLAEILVHEVQHSKLAVIGDLVPLHRADGTAAYRVGWRRGPRPLAAVLQGTYAHLAVADLWHRVTVSREGGYGTEAARGEASGRCAHYRGQVAEALDVLMNSGQLTDAGVQFTVGMREHQERLGRHGTRPVLVGPMSLNRDLT